MISPTVEQAADLLFNTPGRRCLHVAFAITPVSRPTAEDLAGQIIEAERQIASGEAVRVDRID